MGKVAMWHYNSNLGSKSDGRVKDDSLWELLAPCEAGLPVVELQVGGRVFHNVCSPNISSGR